MEHTTSADGTSIAYQSSGSGTPVIIVGGAFSRAIDGAGLAAALAAVGLRGVTIDRRARGESGDTPPYAAEREVEDLAAVIDAAGGSAAVIGHSSGAILSLLAASRGVPVTHLFLSEPPFGFGERATPADLPERLQRMVDEGRPEDVVVTFQREAVGLPDALIEQIRQSPMFAALAGVAQSVVYDATVSNENDDPGPELLGVGVPTTVLCGSETFPFLEAAAARIAAAMPAAELVIVPESRGHRVDPEATARVIAGRLQPRTEA